MHAVNNMYKQLCLACSIALLWVIPFVCSQYVFYQHGVWSEIRGALTP
jgi:hypothetical protein